MEENQNNTPNPIDVYNKSVQKYIGENPNYMTRTLDEFNNLVNNSYLPKNPSNIYNYSDYYDKLGNLSYDSRTGKQYCLKYNPFCVYRFIYVYFFLNNIPMSIVYLTTISSERIGTSKPIFAYNNFIPVAYSKDAVDKNGKPFNIDKLIKDAGVKQLKKDYFYNTISEPNGTYTRLKEYKYMLKYNAPSLAGFSDKTRIYIFPFNSIEKFDNIKDITPLMSDLKNTIEEMKWDPDPSMISFTGEHVREEAKKWDENVGQTSNKRPVDESNIGNDMKRTKISGGKNKKKTKKRKNKRRQTRKRN